MSSSPDEPSALPVLPPVSPDRLRAELDGIVGERNLRSSPAHHAAVARHISETFRDAGFEIRTQPVPSPAGLGHNIIAERRGSEHAERRWLLGAHYDTVSGTPGADDNGIAVAGLLEAARLLGELQLSDSLQLVAWDQEEPQLGAIGITRGSRTMARAARKAGETIVGVLVLEMIGCCRSEPGSQHFPPGFGLLFPQIRRWLQTRDNRGDFLAVIGNDRSRVLSEAMEEAAQRSGLPVATMTIRGAARLIPDFYRSDHTPFWTRGYPALMLTDTANFRNPHYHRPGDTIATIDFDFAAKVMTTVLDAVVTLAGPLA